MCYVAPCGCVRVCVCFACVWLLRQERAKLAALEKQIADADAEIVAAKDDLTRYRAEFEQLRAALLVDRLAKNNQIAALADKKRRLKEEVAGIDEIVEKTRHQAYEDEKQYVSGVSYRPCMATSCWLARCAWWWSCVDC